MTFQRLLTKELIVLNISTVTLPRQFGVATLSRDWYQPRTVKGDNQLSVFNLLST